MTRSKEQRMRRYRLDAPCASYLGQVDDLEYVVLRFTLPYHQKERGVLQALRQKDKPTCITIFLNGNPAIYMKYVQMVSEDWRVQFSHLHSGQTVEVLLSCGEARIYEEPLAEYEKLEKASWPVYLAHLGERWAWTQDREGRGPKTIRVCGRDMTPEEFLAFMKKHHKEAESPDNE